VRFLGATLLDLDGEVVRTWPSPPASPSPASQNFDISQSSSCCLSNLNFSATTQFYSLNILKDSCVQFFLFFGQSSVETVDILRLENDIF
jgi:hypothetical protein